MTADTRGRFRRWWGARRQSSAVAPEGVGPARAETDARVLSPAELAERARAEVLVIGAAVQIVLEEEQRLKAQLDHR